MSWRGSLLFLFWSWNLWLIFSVVTPIVIVDILLWSPEEISLKVVFIIISSYYDLKFDLPVTKSISEFRYFLLVEVYAHIFALNLTCVLISPPIRGVIYLGETSLVKKKKMRERMIFFFNFSHPFFSFLFCFH